MADILNGNWITHDNPIQAKTNIRIEAHNAETNLSNLLSVKIDLTDETPASNAKIKGSKIFSDTGTVALFTPEGDIEEAVKIKGYANSLKAVTTLGIDKARSQCQIYIDSTLCQSSSCRFAIIRIKLPTNALNTELVNPFIENTTVSLSIGGISFTNQNLYDRFKDCQDIDGIDLSELHRYTNRFLNYIASTLSVLNSVTVNENSLTYTTGSTNNVWGYIYVPFGTSIVIGTDVTTYFQIVTTDFQSVCVHIAGVSGLCAGLKVDTGLPPSNIFKTNTVPDILFNCNPFDCMNDYDTGSGYIPACIKKCPYGAIKHKQTLTSSLPIDNNNQIKIISTLKMIERPYED